MTARTSGLRTRWAAVGAAVAITLGAAGIGGLNIANADVSTGDRPVYIPINPCRLMDTRADIAVGPKTSPLGPGETVTVTAHGTNGECTGTSTIPTDALSLSLNVTAVDPTSNTFLTFWGDGPNPGTSNLNPRAGGAPTPNSVNTPISPTGTFNIFNNRGDVNVIVDVNGYYANHNHDDRYLRPLETYVVAPQSFTGNDPAGDSWSVSDVLEHSPSASRECVYATIDLPAGTVISDASLRYVASDSGDIDVGIVGVSSAAGPTTETALFHKITDDTIATTARVPGEIVIESYSYPLSTDATLRPGSSYSAALCTEIGVVLTGLVLTLS